MNKFVCFVFTFCLFSALTSCMGNVPATSVSVPTPILITPTSSPKLNLDDFPNKEFVGEDNNYSVYLINRTGGTDAAPTGELLVYDKSTDHVIRMSGSFTVIIEGGTIVFDDGKGEYVLLSIGTYTSRTAVVLSLNDQKQAVNDFCMTTPGLYEGHLFWNNYIIINNCGTFTNRPWGIGEAPSIIAINLDTGTETVIAKSDLMRQFQVKLIEGNNLRYIETYVDNEEDWINVDKQKTDEKTYDLSLLSNSK
jgi:hypothetical protein